MTPEEALRAIARIVDEVLNLGPRDLEETWWRVQQIALDALPAEEVER